MCVCLGGGGGGWGGLQIVTEGMIRSLKGRKGEIDSNPSKIYDSIFFETCFYGLNIPDLSFIIKIGSIFCSFSGSKFSCENKLEFG